MKGLPYLLKGLGEIKKEDHPPFKLLILGRDQEGPYLRLAKRLGMDRDIIFAGSTKEPEKYYGASDFLVHPTFYDACSLTVLEALASGLPVITTHCNGAGGIITQGQEGFVISDPRDDQTLVEKISFFLNREKVEKASIAARYLAESYSLGRNWREMENTFQKKILEGVTPG
jgi:UDP-glucose:(heptosyl)LPS alpha-1,3-glucosyltransferase